MEDKINENLNEVDLNSEIEKLKISIAGKDVFAKHLEEQNKKLEEENKTLKFKLDNLDYKEEILDNKTMRDKLFGRFKKGDK